MGKLKEHFQSLLDSATEKLTAFVNSITSQAQQQRIDLAEKYDKKLNKIKDICAQYFSKYEKHLINQQDLVKTLEKRQEEWVQKLIKPQELN